MRTLSDDFQNNSTPRTFRNTKPLACVLFDDEILGYLIEAWNKQYQFQCKYMLLFWRARSQLAWLHTVIAIGVAGDFRFVARNDIFTRKTITISVWLGRVFVDSHTIQAHIPVPKMEFKQCTKHYKNLNWSETNVNRFCFEWYALCGSSPINSFVHKMSCLFRRQQQTINIDCLILTLCVFRPLGACVSVKRLTISGCINVGVHEADMIDHQNLDTS